MPSPFKLDSPEHKKWQQIPNEVWSDLIEAEYTPEEIISWSGEEIFEKYCEWNGLLGSWHRTLWRVVNGLREVK